MELVHEFFLHEGCNDKAATKSKAADIQHTEEQLAQPGGAGYN